MFLVAMVVSAVVRRRGLNVPASDVIVGCVYGIS